MASTTERLRWQVSLRSASPDHLYEQIVFGHGSESAFLIQTLRWTVVSPYRQTQWQALRCCMALQRSQRSHCGAAAASWRRNGDIHQAQLIGCGVHHHAPYWVAGTQQYQLARRWELVAVAGLLCIELHGYQLLEQRGVGDGLLEVVAGRQIEFQQKRLIVVGPLTQGKWFR